MIVARTRAELAAAREKLAAPVVLVPTMGALHDGHRALLRRARELAGPGGAVAVSIFVNPLQFGPNEDLDSYPRTLDADLAACRGGGRRTWCSRPRVREMYPQEQLVRVDPGPTGEILEGEFRPGFFHGVLTVVLKLFSLVRPDIAVFGQKDAQQLVLVRRMSRRLRARHRDRGGPDGAGSRRARPVEQEQVPVGGGAGGGAGALPGALGGRGGRRGRARPRSSPPRRRCSRRDARDAGRAWAVAPRGLPGAG